MNNNVLVSIVSFSFNQKAYIKKALDSFLEQKTNFKFEIIIHDDASTDGALEIIEEYVQKYPNIINPIYQKENQYSQGLFHISKVLEHCKGMYIALCEGDDYWTDPLKLQKQVDFLEANSEFMGCSHNTRIQREDNLNDELIVNNFLKDVYTINDFTKGEAYFHTSSWVYRYAEHKSKVNKILVKSEGDWFISMVFASFGPIKYLDEVMSVYRIHDQGVWSELSAQEKVIKNLEAILKINKAFDYKYEKNFLNLFARISANNQVLSEKLYSELDQYEIRGLLEIIVEKDQIIAEKDQELIRLTSSRSWKTAKVLSKIYSLFSVKRIFSFVKRMLKSIHNSWNYKALNYIFIDDLTKLACNFEVFLEKRGRTSTVKGATLYNKNDVIRVLPTLTERVLDIKVGLFKKILIIGTTDALIYEKKLFHQELLMREEYHDLKRADVFENLRLKEGAILVRVRRIIKKCTESNTLYVSLLKEHSINYYHWITENIPRLILILNEIENNERLLKNKKVVILIDNDVPPQCIEIVNLLTPFEFSVQFIKKAEMCLCHNLIYCAPLWQSQDNTRGTLNQAEFFVDEYAINLVYDAIKGSVELSNKAAYRKVYLRRRPSQMRSIINTEEVEAYMRANSFEIIETDTLSFVEQVKLFHETKLIVGASGATFTNILFMQAESKAVIFFPAHPSVNHGIFQPLADVAGVNLIHFETNAADMISIHSNFSIDVYRLKRLLEKEVFVNVL